jgi:HNH endonuclease
VGHREHRGADALIQLCDHSGHSEDDHDGLSLAPRPLFVVEVPQRGPAEIAGIPLPDAMVEQLRANASIEPVLVDDHGTRIASGARRSALSPKITRAVLRRDGHCRWPGCERRTGLQIHHLLPRSWGGSDDLANLAAVCTGGGSDHHAKLVPHGDWALAGNPNQPDGLRLVHLGDLTDEQAEQLGLPPPELEPNRRPRAGSP